MEFTKMESFLSNGNRIKEMETVKQEEDHLPKIFHCMAYLPCVALFVGCEDGRIFRWMDKVQGHKMYQGNVLEGHSGKITSLVLLENDSVVNYNTGKSILMLVSGSIDGRIRIWNSLHKDRSKACMQVIQAHNGIVNHAMIGPENTILSCSGRKLMLWQKDTGRSLLLNPWYSLGDTVNATRPITAMASHPLQKTFYAGDDEGYVYAYMVEKGTDHGRKVNLLSCMGKLHELSISEMIVIAEQNVVASISFDGCLHLFDGRTAIKRATLENKHNGRFVKCAWDKKWQHLYIVDNKKAIIVWDPFTNVVQKEIIMGSVIYDVCKFESKQVQCVATLNQDTVQVYTVQHDVKTTVYAGHNDEILAICPISSAFEDEVATIFTLSADNSVLSWETNLFEPKSIYSDKKLEVSCMAHMSSLDILFMGTLEGNIIQWKMKSGSFNYIKAHNNDVAHILILMIQNVEFVVSCSRTGSLVLWDTSDIRKHQLVEVHRKAMFEEKCDVCCLISLPAMEIEGIIAIGSATGQISIFALAERKTLSIFDTKHTQLSNLAVDGYLLFTSAKCSLDVRIWNLCILQEPYLLYNFKAHDDPIHHMQYFTSLHLLATCTKTGVLRLWSYEEVSPTNLEPEFLVREIRIQQSISCLSICTSSTPPYILCGSVDGDLVAYDATDAKNCPLL